MMGVFCLIATIYSLCSIIPPQKTFFTSDTGMRWLETQTIMRQGILDPSIPYTGKDIISDMSFHPIIYPQRITKNNKDFTNVTMVFPFLTYMSIHILGERGMRVIPVISALIVICLLALIAEKHFKIKSLSLFTIVIAFAHPVFFYSGVLWDHETALVFSLASVMAFMNFLSSQKTKDAILATILMTIAYIIRPEYAAYLLCMIFFISKKNIRILILLFIVVGIVFLPFGIIRYRMYGTFMDISAESNYSKYFSLNVLSYIEDRIYFLYRQVVGLVSDNGIQYILIIPYVLMAVFYFKKLFNDKNKKLFIFLSLMCATVTFCDVWFTKNNFVTGIFTTTPFLLLIFFPEEWDNKTRDLVQFAIISLIVGILIMPVNTGRHAGPRFFLLTSICLYMPSWALWESLRLKQKSVYKTGIYLLFVSAVVEIISLYAAGLHRFEIYKLYVNIKNAREQVVATTVWWIPQELSDLYYKKKMFYIKSPARLAVFLKEMERHDIKRFILIISGEKENIPTNVGPWSFVFIKDYYIYHNVLIFEVIYENEQRPSIRYQVYEK